MNENENENEKENQDLLGFVTRCWYVSSENSRAKRRKTDEARPSEAAESEQQEEHSLTLSQHSSPSQSDQEQNGGGAHKLSPSPNASVSALQPFARLKANDGAPSAPGRGGGGVSSRPALKTDQFLRTVAPQHHRQEVQFLSSDHKKPQPRPAPGPPLVCHSVSHANSSGTMSSVYRSRFVMLVHCFCVCRLAQRSMGRSMELSIPGTS